MHVRAIRLVAAFEQQLQRKGHVFKLKLCGLIWMHAEGFVNHRWWSRRLCQS
jgi:hypothetical protein